MALTMANTASETLMSTMPPVQTLVPVPEPTAAIPTAAAAAAPVAGDNSNGQAVPASATVMIVIGVILGILGVATVITVIWWMRRRQLARLRAHGLPPPQTFHYPPAPPPKTSQIGGGSKGLPQINVASANAYRPGATRAARSATVNSVDKDKALPIKPVESVWSSPTSRPKKSPALTAVAEMKAQNPPRQYDEEAAIDSRMRSDSVSEGKEPIIPANFI